MIPLFKPYMPELPELEQILKSGQLAYGVYGRKFEDVLSKYLSAEYVTITNSFNMAILVALSCLEVHIGDEVLLSPMACLASTQPLVSAGIKIRWADVDPNTGTLSPDSVKKRITKKTKAIIHNHYCGSIGYIDEINSIAKEYGLPIIDDCIEAFGGEYKGKKLGNVGSDATVFSFTAVRVPNTIDGGAVIFRDKSLYEKSILIRDCGIDRSAFRDSMGEIDKKCDIAIAGYSATMSDVNAYIGIKQMEVVPQIIKKQRDNARKWDIYIENNFDGFRNLLREEICPSYWVYGLLVKDKILSLNAFRRLGFYASSVHLNNNCYSVFGKNVELNGVTEFYNHFIALPCGWWVESI